MKALKLFPPSPFSKSFLCLWFWTWNFTFVDLINEFNLFFGVNDLCDLQPILVLIRSIYTQIHLTKGNKILNFSSNGMNES